MASIKDALTGYVRVIKFLPSGTKPDGKTIDPNQADKNLIQEVFEGYFEKGGVSKEARYGRWFTGSVCYLGYFSFDTDNTQYRFLGKGLNYKADGQQDVNQEGIFNLSLTTPSTKKKIIDFRENELPPS